MKSIKPGRGPSAMGAIGSAVAAVFGFFWTIGTVTMGAPIFFSLFGILFVIMAIVQGVYNYKNATNKNRYSLYDITDDAEEKDPLQELLYKGEDTPNKEDNNTSNDSEQVNYCPYCGNKAKENFKFCKKCGEKLS